MRSDLINSRDPSICRQTPCRLVQPGSLPSPPSLHCPLPSLNCSLAAVRFTVPMHSSLCMCGQMALSVLDCELVSISLFVYPSVTCNIYRHHSLQLDQTWWNDACLRFDLAVSQLHWLLTGRLLFCPWVMSSIVERQKKTIPTTLPKVVWMRLTGGIFRFTWIEQTGGGLKNQLTVEKHSHWIFFFFCIQ